MREREVGNGGLFGEYYGLDTRDIEALTAAHILAHHQVIFAQHVGTGFGETSPVALIGARWQLALLGAHDPGNFILRGLMAMRTVERCWFFLRALVEKLTFFHSVALAVRRRPPASSGDRPANIDYYRFRAGRLWQDGCNGQEEEESKTVSRRAGGEGAGSGTNWHTSGATSRSGQEEERVGETQAHIGKNVGRCLACTPQGRTGSDRLGHAALPSETAFN
jgi:hypothetical protein